MFASRRNLPRSDREGPHDADGDSGSSWRRSPGGARSGATRGGSSSRRGRARRIGRARGTGARWPVHVTLRACDAHPFASVGARLPVSCRRSLAASHKAAFRVVHFSVQTDHVHLVVEGDEADRPRPRPAGAGRPLRQGRQPGGPAARERVEQPLSRARAPHADGDAARARLRLSRAYDLRVLDGDRFPGDGHARLRHVDRLHDQRRDLSLA